jgi:hypothetical protein
MKLLARNKRNFEVRLLIFGIGMLAAFGLFAFPMAGQAVAAQLELDDQMGGPGSTVIYTLSVNDTPNAVSSFGVDIGYCGSILRFESYDFSGGLLDSFSFKDVSTPAPGVLRVGGFTAAAPMPAGASGFLVKLRFTVLDCDQGQECNLPLSGLKDGMVGWTTRNGLFTCIENIEIEPADVTLCKGASVEFTVIPAGLRTPPFEWRVDGALVQDSDSPTFLFKVSAPGVYTIRVDDAAGKTAQATATVEDEDDSGALDIPSAAGQSGKTVTIPVRMQSAPNLVSSLGFEVLYDPAILTFTGGDYAGTLLQDWTFKDASSPSAGLVRVGGFTVGTAIPAGTDGDLVYLTFEVTCEECTSTKLALDELKDHLSGWPTSGGCFLACCRCTGDVNDDGEITPMDALCAFEVFMDICPTTCGIACEDICCDVTEDDDCTPADAQCIFLKYLELPSCLDD